MRPSGALCRVRMALSATSSTWQGGGEEAKWHRQRCATESRRRSAAFAGPAASATRCLDARRKPMTRMVSAAFTDRQQVDSVIGALREASFEPERIGVVGPDGKVVAITSSVVERHHAGSWLK